MPCCYGIGAARGETLGITSSNYVDIILLLEKEDGYVTGMQVELIVGFYFAVIGIKNVEDK